MTYNSIVLNNLEIRLDIKYFHKSVAFAKGNSPSSSSGFKRKK